MLDIVAYRGRFGEEHLLNKSVLSPRVCLLEEWVFSIRGNRLIILNHQLRAQRVILLVSQPEQHPMRAQVLADRFAPDLARSDFAVPDSTCRMFPRRLPSRKALDSTRRLAAHVSMLRPGAPAHPIADQLRCRKQSPVSPGTRQCRRILRMARLALAPSAVSIPSTDSARRRHPDARHRH